MKKMKDIEIFFRKLEEAKEIKNNKLTDIGLLKLKKEFEELEDNPMTDIGCQVWLKNEDDYYVWEGMMQGPKNTPYKGAFLYFTIKFGKDFPESPPDFLFSYKNMYHLNVNPHSGHVCISILNNWKPQTKIRKVIHAVNLILDKQNPKSPYQFEDDRVKLYQEKKEEFDNNVREWVKRNALKTTK